MSEALAQAMCERFQGAGHRAVVAGGWVRDRLLDRPSGDLDIATSARPEQVMALFGARLSHRPAAWNGHGRDRRGAG